MPSLKNTLNILLILLAALVVLGCLSTQPALAEVPECSSFLLGRYSM